MFDQLADVGNARILASESVAHLPRIRGQGNVRIGGRTLRTAKGIIWSGGFSRWLI